MATKNNASEAKVTTLYLTMYSHSQRDGPDLIVSASHAATKGHAIRIGPHPSSIDIREFRLSPQFFAIDHTAVATI